MRVCSKDRPGGTVKNVVLEGVQITSDNSLGSVGGVAGYSYGNIEYCSVSGSVSVSGISDVGGVAGYQVGGPITGCAPGHSEGNAAGRRHGRCNE